MGKFKVSRMNQGGFDVAFGDSYYTFPSAPNAVAAAVAGMQAVIAENPGTLPIELVKSMDDRQLQQGVIRTWSNLVKNGQAGGVPTPQAPRPQPQQFQPESMRKSADLGGFQPQQFQGEAPVTRRQAMAFLMSRIQELHEAQLRRDAQSLQKTEKGAYGALPQMEGPAAINALIKSLNTTFIRINMMPAEIASAAQAAAAQGVQIPTPEEYFQQHPMYPALAKDVRKWIAAGNYAEE